MILLGKFFLGELDGPGCRILIATKEIIYGTFEEGKLKAKTMAIQWSHNQDCWSTFIVPENGCHHFEYTVKMKPQREIAS